jgi:hypothetical protein
VLDSGPAWTSPNNVVGGGGLGGGGGSGSEDTLEMNDEMMDVNERMMDGSPVGGDGSNTARRTPPGDAVRMVTVEIDTQVGPVQTVGLDPHEVEQAHKAGMILAGKVAANGPASEASLYNLHVSLL